ncbi:MAG: zinc-ribbon domain-containing protein [Rickettsiaceae bacterium]
MYISCPKCSANFVVTVQQIGKLGRKVKCSKCHHVWHQMPIEGTTIEAHQDHIEIPKNISPNDYKFTPSNGLNLPAILPIKIPKYLYYLPFILIALIMMLSIMLFKENFGISHILSREKFNIRDVQVDYSKNLNKIIVTYKVVNISDNKAKMPLVRIRLFDKNHKIIKTHIANQTSAVLSGKQFVTIKTEFDSMSDDAQEADITLGNKLDFILR